MAGYENIKNKGFDKRTTEELREIASRAGKASGEVRRKKANFKKTLNSLLTANIDSEEWTPLLSSLGIESTLESAMLMAMIKEAISGDVKAANFVAQYSGQSNKSDADEEEQGIRIDREKRSRDLEVGDFDSSDNIKDFLDALRPVDKELEELFVEEEDAEKEETSEI